MPSFAVAAAAMFSFALVLLFRRTCRAVPIEPSWSPR